MTVATTPTALPVTFCPHRVLISWMNDQEQTMALLGRQPLPTDDLDALALQKAEFQKALQVRSLFTPAVPFTPIENETLREALAARPDILLRAQEQNGELVMVDLKQIVAFQQLVYTNGLEERIASAIGNPKNLVELCFPTNAVVEINLTQDPGGLSLISSSPNVSVGPGQVVQNGPNNFAMVFPILHSLNFLSVASFQGRHFLRDGYHRSAALLRAGVELVPCMHIQAQSIEQAGWRPGMLAPTTLFSERLPLLPDFWDDSVSCSAIKQATRRISRVRIDTFDIPA